MLNILKEYISRKGWKFTEIEDKDALFFGISGRYGNFQCIASVIEDRGFFNFCSEYKLKVPDEKRSEVLEFINTLNYNLYFGHFEIDPEDGLIRYRSTLPYKLTSVNNELLELIIMTNIGTMDVFLHGYMEVINSGMTTLEAMEVIKNHKLKKTV